MNNITKNTWHFIAQIDLGDFLTLEDVKVTYLQNYLDQGYTDIKFEPLGQKKYKVYLRRAVPVSKAAILAIKIQLLKAQLKNYPDKRKEILNEISFWKIALKNCRRGLKLADWEAGLPDDLRSKIRNRKYLPTYAEVSKIPYKQRESYQEKFFDYEIWNQEYIKILVAYLAKFKNAKILEVGAGSGRLSYFLRQQSVKPLNIMTTDISLKNRVVGMPLIKMSMKQALAEFKPDILICAWPDTFFWQEIKYNHTAKQIILIGDIEDTPLAKEVKGEWQWLQIKGFKAKEFLAAKKVQTSRDSLGTTLNYLK